MFNESFKYYKSKNTLPSFKDIIDFNNNYERLINDKKICKLEVSKAASSEEIFGLKPVSEWDIFELTSHKGLIFIKNPFTNAGQRYLAIKCLENYPEKPNKNNLDIDDTLKDVNHLWEFCQSTKDRKLFNKLRWVTLGYHHNWDTKKYSEHSKGKFPNDLAHIIEHIARTLNFSEFKAEAAIVNYYHMNSTLSGHTDHSEENLEAPLFSLSLGQSAIFLLGGTTRDTKPKAMFLRSGDVVIMSQATRLCYHGVPRIVEEKEKIWDEFEDENVSLSSQIATFIDINKWRPFSDYLKGSRININVRQVLKKGHNQLSSALNK